MTVIRVPDGPFVLVGAGEFGRDCVSVVHALAESGRAVDFLGWVDDGRVGEVVAGFPVLGGVDWLAEQDTPPAAIVTIGVHPARLAVADRLEAAGVPFANLVHPNVQIGPNVRLGRGVVLMAGVSITIDAEIADHVGVNPGCTIAHDVRLGRGTYVSPGVHIAGRVTVHERVFVGVGASILPRRTIGAGSVIGGGAVVVHDVAPGETVVGVPARPLRTEQERSE